MDVDRLASELPHLRDEYRDAHPFPHIVLDDLLDPDTFRTAVSEFPTVDGDHWTSYLHVNERKHGNTHLDTWGPTLQSVADALMSPPFLAFLEELTGIPGLLPDPTFDGGGLHRTTAGGFLNIHTDFTAHHTNPTWHRRVNLLLYLNAEWDEAWGGHLELWEPDMRACAERVLPKGNRAVIFSTTERALHGHPTPLAAPEGIARQSMALYYFTEGARPVIKATDYRARPEDGAKRVLIWLDKKSLRGYDVVKRRLGISDAAISRVLTRTQRVRDSMGRRR